MGLAPDYDINLHSRSASYKTRLLINIPYVNPYTVFESGSSYMYCKCLPALISAAIVYNSSLMLYNYSNQYSMDFVKLLSRQTSLVPPKLK